MSHTRMTVLTESSLELPLIIMKCWASHLKTPFRDIFMILDQVEEDIEQVCHVQDFSTN